MKNKCTEVKNVLLKHFINGKCFLLSLYIAFIFGMHSIIVYDSSKGIIRGVLLSFLLSFFIIPVAYKKIADFDFSFVNRNPNSTEKKHKILFFLVPFFALLVCYYIFYPGVLHQSDCAVQFNQAYTNQYDDWHPALHTFIAYKIPLLLSGNKVGPIVFFQILELSLSIYYSLCSIDKYVNKKVSLIIMLFYTFNPQIIYMAMYPVKDVAFAIGSILMVTFLFNIIFTKGEWITKKRNMIFLVLTISITTIITHNAILFTLPYLIAMCMYYKNKKQIIFSTFSCVACILLIKGPFYSYLNVAKPTNRNTEVLGLPMSIIGQCVSKSPELLDKDVLEFAYKVAPKKIWESNYSGGFNSVKWSSDNWEVVDEAGVKYVLNLMIKCFKESPRNALKGFANTTCSVYSIVDDCDYTYIPSLHTNEWNCGIIRYPQKFYYVYESVVSVLLPHLFIYIGSMHLILLTVFLTRKTMNCKEFLKQFFIVLPVFSYDFGTMLLLSGVGDSARFFFYTFLVVPILVIILLKPKENVAKIEE